jgi:hypothetical protein
VPRGATRDAGRQYARARGGPPTTRRLRKRRRFCPHARPHPRPPGPPPPNAPRELALNLSPDLVREFDDRWWNAARKGDEAATREMLRHSKSLLPQVVDDNGRRRAFWLFDRSLTGFCLMHEPSASACSSDCSSDGRRAGGALGARAPPAAQRAPPRSGAALPSHIHRHTHTHTHTHSLSLSLSRLPPKNSALHFAAAVNAGPCIKLLLEAGADPDLQDREGYTPLHMAAGAGRGRGVAGFGWERGVVVPFRVAGQGAGWGLGGAAAAGLAAAACVG